MISSHFDDYELWIYRVKRVGNYNEIEWKSNCEALEHQVEPDQFKSAMKDWWSENYEVMTGECHVSCRDNNVTWQVTRDNSSIFSWSFEY